jgi:glycosyltransferase 2 family protein
MWSTAAKFAVSAGLIWFAFRNQDLAALWHQFVNVNRWSLFAATAILAILTLPTTLRWSLILRTMGEPRPFHQMLVMVWIGLFFNQTLPSAIGGDVIRMWFAHKIGLSAAKAITSVVIDRIYGFVALLVLIAFAFPGLAGLPLDPMVKRGVAATVICGLALFAAIMLLDRVPRAFLNYRVIRGIAGCARDIRTIFLRPRLLAAIVALGLCAQIGGVVAVFILARGLGLQVAFLPCALIVCLVGLILAVPISIAGWGVREGSFIAGFGLLGVASSDALALSVLYGLITTLIGLIGGAMWLASDRLIFGELPGPAATAKMTGAIASE